MIQQFEFKGKTIRMAKTDKGVIWVCLTDIAKASGKLFADWKRLKSTSELLSELQESMGIPIDKMLYVNESSGDNSKRGTWAIQEIGIEFAGWCSVSFSLLFAVIQNK